MKDKIHLLHKKKWIQWVLDFAQLDLNSLSPQASRNLLVEISYFCSEGFQKRDWEEYERRLALLLPEELKGLSEITEIGNGLDIAKLQKRALNLLDSMNFVHKPRREDRVIERILLTLLPEMSAYISSPWPGSFEIVREPKDPSPENWLIFNFIGLVEKFEAYPIKKCKGMSKDKECGRYFLNLTMREKLFCTPSCASRSIQSEKREKLRKTGKWKAYLRKMRKYQKARYDERIRTNLGPNVQVGRKRMKKRRVNT